MSTQLADISTAMADSAVSDLDSIPVAPKDPMFGLTAAFQADTDVFKVNLGVGVYKDQNARPWILPSVAEADRLINETGDFDHEYLPILGLSSYLAASQALVFGTNIEAEYVASAQTLSGTGALSLASRFISSYFTGSSRRVAVSNPAYVHHIPILHDAGLPTGTYAYYSASSKQLDIDGMLASLAALPEGTTVLLQACAHNPTGVDPTKAQWQSICNVFLRRKLIPFFDFAYQGFATGDIDNDAWSIRHFVAAGFPVVLVAQSYAKNFGLYGERAGCLHLITAKQQHAAAIRSQLQRLQRVSISTPPAYGARIVAKIYHSPELFRAWNQDLQTMSSRISKMRRALRQRLDGPNAVRWQHLTDQIGMFCYTGLTPAQVDELRSVYHIYMTTDGRISISGLNDGNVDYVANAFRSVTQASRL